MEPTRLETYTFFGKNYYIASDIYKLEPESFVGCSKNTRQMILKKNISQNNHIYASFIKSKNCWEVKDSKYNQAKPFISVEWVHKNLICFKEKEEKTNDDLEIESLKAPPILQLNNFEKFVDVDGNILDIEIRGNKSIDNIYFKVVDVQEKFNINDIYDSFKKSIKRQDNCWINKVHYVFFFISSDRDIVPVSTNKNNTKYLYLTYKGLTKLLYVSRSKNAEHFQDWSNKILFTYQFGSKEEKRELASSLLGVDANSVKEVFRSDTNTLPCVYLFSLNLVKELRESMNIDSSIKDDSIVCKYGFTNNLSRRTSEHLLKFGKINGCSLRLKYYSYVDPQYLSQAENDISDFMKFSNFKIQYVNNEEIVVIPKEHIKIVEKQYQQISKSYMGHVTELVNQIKELSTQNELQKLTYENELQKERYEKELLKKDVEILKLKLNSSMRNNCQ